MKLKEGVRLTGIRPELIVGLMVAESRWPGELTITSGVDGRHSRTSLHYAGAAVDLRTRDLPLDEDGKQALAARISGDLGPDFDVVFEGGFSEHVHLEWQPKRG